MRSFVLVLVAGCAQQHTPPPPPPPDAASAASIEVPDASVADAAEDVALAAEAGPAANEVTTSRFQAMIYDQARFDSFHLGWFRAGARVKVTEKVPPGPNVHNCPGTWWKVDPHGYVCEGGKEGITHDFSHPNVVMMSRYQAKRGEPLPYRYAMSNGAHLYGRIPNEREQKANEKELDLHLKHFEKEKEKDPNKWALALPLEPIPDFLQNGGQGPQLYSWGPQGKVLRTGYAVMYTRLGLVAAFESGGRNWYLTTEGYVVAADRMTTHKASEMKGIELTGDARLPVVFIRYGEPAIVWKLDDKLAKPTDKRVPVRGHVEIADKPLQLSNGSFYEILHPEFEAEPGVKYLLSTASGTRVDPAKEKPEKVGDKEVWIEVRIGTQVLVVYEGLTPRYATLVSTGAGKKHETPLGQFRVYQKHVTTKMSADEKPPEEEGEKPEAAYRYDDVGYTQFIFEGIALHTAFWHDGFGLPRSHGCINLSPKDAQWVFEKTLPRVPEGWHGMSAGRGGVPLGSIVWIKY